MERFLELDLDGAKEVSTKLENCGYHLRMTHDIEIAKKEGVRMLFYASTSPAITDYEDDGYLFRVVPSDAQQGVALARTVEASGATDVAVISMTNDYGAGFASAFTGAFTEEPCMSATYDEDTTDFSSIVADAMANDCENVVMITYATDGAALAEEFATQGFEGMIQGFSNEKIGTFTVSLVL